MDMKPITVCDNSGCGKLFCKPVEECDDCIKKNAEILSDDDADEGKLVDVTNVRIIGKYDKESKEFNDPVVRCCDCNQILFREKLRELGMCQKCGNRKVKSISILSADELNMLKNADIDQAFLDCFEGVG
jgi:uncharacterized protein (DUF983 family)